MRNPYVKVQAVSRTNGRMDRLSSRNASKFFNFGSIISDNAVCAIISLWGFFRCSRAAYSAVLGCIWPNFELLWAFTHVYVLKARQLCGPRSDLAEFRTIPSSYVCHRYLQARKGSEQIQLRKSKTAEKKWRHRFSYYKSMGIFPMLKGR